MKSYRYLIIGGGMTADAAVRGIRSVDSEGTIGLVGEENELPYNRPPLTKGLWKGRPLERIFRKTDQQEVEFHIGLRAVELDPERKLVTTADGQQFQYERLLLATGGSPARLRDSSERVIYYRTLEDYRSLRAQAEKGDRIVVIGGGFIGSEIAAALRMFGKQVTMIFPEEGISARILPIDMANFLVDYYRNEGVHVVPGQMIAGVVEQGSQLVARTQSGEEYPGDVVVAGLGIRPNVELAQQAGLHVDNGIVVDSSMRTTRPDIYAAGDVANFPALEIGPAEGVNRMRFEHEENANLSGMVAGKSMAGEESAYLTLPMFYSDLFDIAYEAVGELDPKLGVFEDWTEPYRKGVLYYQREGRVVGVLTAGISGKMPAARELIDSREIIPPAELKGRIRAEGN